MAGEIPDIVIGRLPIYLRELKRLTREEKTTTSSQELGRRLGISSAQIRKDLSHFGEFGKQGTGYHIEYLTEQLLKILHLTKKWDVAIIGAGFLGHALANYGGFGRRGFRIACIFDNNPAQIGRAMGELTVQHVDELEETIADLQIKLAIIAVPAEKAQEITDRLIEAGIKAILTYAPVPLKAPDGIRISYSDPVVQMQKMVYYLPPN